MRRRKALRDLQETEEKHPSQIHTNIAPGPLCLWGLVMKEKDTSHMWVGNVFLLLAGLLDAP